MEYNGIKFDTTGGKNNNPNQYPVPSSLEQTAIEYFFITRYFRDLSEYFTARKERKAKKKEL